MTLCLTCQSSSKFPRSQYIWQYFISDLRISERILVQAQSLVRKHCSVWKAKAFTWCGIPSSSSYPFFFLPFSLWFAPYLQRGVDLAVSTGHWMNCKGAVHCAANPCVWLLHDWTVGGRGKMFFNYPNPLALNYYINMTVQMMWNEDNKHRNRSLSTEEQTRTCRWCSS